MNIKLGIFYDLLEVLQEELHCGYFGLIISGLVVVFVLQFIDGLINSNKSSFRPIIYSIGMYIFLFFSSLAAYKFISGFFVGTQDVLAMKADHTYIPEQAGAIKVLDIIEIIFLVITFIKCAMDAFKVNVRVDVADYDYFNDRMTFLYGDSKNEELWKIRISKFNDAYFKKYSKLSSDLNFKKVNFKYSENNIEIPYLYIKNSDRTDYYSDVEVFKKQLIDAFCSIKLPGYKMNRDEIEKIYSDCEDIYDIQNRTNCVLISPYRFINEVYYKMFKELYFKCNEDDSRDKVKDIFMQFYAWKQGCTSYLIEDGYDAYDPTLFCIDPRIAIATKYGEYDTEEEKQQRRASDIMLKLQTQSSTHYLNDVKNEYEKNLFKFAILSDKLADSYRNVIDEYVKDYGIIMTGAQGEANVMEVLENFGDDLLYFRNIVIGEGKSSAENDYLVLTKKGIFTLEVKNLGTGGSYSLNISKDGRWTKVFNNGEEEVINNYSSQSARHVIITRKSINEELKKLGVKESIDIKSVVVLANDIVDINNDSENKIVRYSELYSILDSGEEIYSERLLKKVADVINNIKQDEHGFKMVDYETYLKNINKEFDSNYSEIEELFNQVKTMIEKINE